MSVIVQDLTKIYGQQKAVNNINFEAKKGEVLGFLGPNGAGKTTTMKIVTCYLPQTHGKATVCGYDVTKNPLEVRAKIGYLPEHNPVYKEMYVKEYLAFVAGLHKVKNKRQRVGEMIERTGLEREQNKIIGSLSKGYRQRVGLAQAMLHDPEVLILDEPTSGLDPNQLLEIRNLIKGLGEEKTVIFSTHIMQEVPAICDRVVIINKGEIVANDSIENLQDKVRKSNTYTVEFSDKVLSEHLLKINPIKKVNALGGNRWQLISDKNQDIAAELSNFIVSKQLNLREMKLEIPTVEDVFRTFTNG